MPWRRAKQSFYKICETADYYFGPYARTASARITQTAMAVYENQRVKQYRDGARQLFRLPEFLKVGEQTRSLLLRSAKTNLLYYLVPAILIPRLMEALQKTDGYTASPEPLQNVEDWILWSAVTLSVTRLFLRRLRDNGAYFVAYSPLITHDVGKHLPHALAEGLANQLSKMFDKIFLSHTNTEGSYENFFQDLYSLFTLFFKKSLIKKETFKELEKPLSEIFEKTIKNQDLLNVLENFIQEFSICLAKEILTELASHFEPSSLLTQQPSKDELFAVLKNSFFPDVALKYSVDLRECIAHVEKNVQSFLPIVHHPGCECVDTHKIVNLNTPEYYRRMAHGMFSSAIYSTGNTAFTFLPKVLNYFNMISWQTFLMAKIFAICTQILIAGYMQEEYRLSSWYCNRHRSQLLGNNVSYGFGVGTTQRVLVELFALGIYCSTGVRTMATEDALNQFVMQMIAITMLAYHDSLPNKNKKSINWFFFPQQAMRLIMSMLIWCVTPDPYNPGVRGACLEKLKYFATSKIFFDVMWLIWGKGEAYPDAIPGMKDLKTGEIKPSDPLGIVLTILFDNEATRLVLDLQNQNISSAVKVVAKVQKVTEWIAPPLLALPMPAPVSIPLNVLKEPGSANGLERIRLELLKKSHTATPGKLILADETMALDTTGLVKDIADAMADTIGSSMPEPKPTTILKVKEKNENDFVMIEKKGNHPLSRSEQKGQAVSVDRKFKVKAKGDDDYMMVQPPKRAARQGLLQNGLWKIPVLHELKNYVEDVLYNNKTPSNTEIIKKEDVELHTYSYRK